MNWTQELVLNFSSSIFELYLSISARIVLCTIAISTTFHLPNANRTHTYITYMYEESYRHIEDIWKIYKEEREIYQLHL